MKNYEEYRFKINAYTPDTMPLVRLAEYLKEIADLLGEEKFVHFSRLELGSTVVVQRIEPEAIPKVRERTESASVYEMSAYKNLNKLLQEDNATGVLITGESEILQFLGVKKPKLETISIQQTAEIDGRVVSVGGMKEIVPVSLEVDGKRFGNCWAKRSIAKLLGEKLFEPVRLFGEGTWNRNEEGQWVVEKFTIHNFEPLIDEPLSTAVSSLQDIAKNSFNENAINDILNFRYGGEQ